MVKLFRLCLSTFTYPFCWKFAHIQPVPKNGDRSNPSNYCLIALISCLSKAFESLLNKIMRHLSAHNLLSDCQYGFRKGRSTGDLAFLTESWSSSFRDVSETFAVGLDISKAFDRVWHKSLISKLLSYRFYFLCTFISSFLSDRSIAAVMDSHCSSLKPINSGVPQGSVLSPTFYLLFINNLLYLTQCLIHSYANDTTLCFSTLYNRPRGVQSSQGSDTASLPWDSGKIQRTVRINRAGFRETTNNAKKVVKINYQEICMQWQQYIIRNIKC